MIYFNHCIGDRVANRIDDSAQEWARRRLGESPNKKLRGETNKSDMVLRRPPPNREISNQYGDITSAKEIIPPIAAPLLDIRWATDIWIIDCVVYYSPIDWYLGDSMIHSLIGWFISTMIDVSPAQLMVWFVYALNRRLTDNWMVDCCVHRYWLAESSIGWWRDGLIRRI